MMRMPLALSEINVGAAANWWDEINESVKWQEGIFFGLCGAYALVSAVAPIQLIRIELRVPEYGWTTQKVFHLMNFIVNGVRAVVLGFHKQVFLLHPKALTLILLDLPGLLFFSTYTLLVLFGQKYITRLEVCRLMNWGFSTFLSMVQYTSYSWRKDGNVLGENSKWKGQRVRLVSGSARIENCRKRGDEGNIAIA